MINTKLQTSFPSLQKWEVLTSPSTISWIDSMSKPIWEMVDLTSVTCISTKSKQKMRLACKLWKVRDHNSVAHSTSRNEGRAIFLKQVWKTRQWLINIIQELSNSNRRHDWGTIHCFLRLCSLKSTKQENYKYPIKSNKFIYIRWRLLGKEQNRAQFHLMFIWTL